MAEQDYTNLDRVYQPASYFLNERDAFYEDSDSDSDSSYEYNEGDGVMQRIDNIQYNHPENKQFPLIYGLELYDTDELMNKYDDKFASRRMQPKRTLPEMSDAEYQKNLDHLESLIEVTSTLDYYKSMEVWISVTEEVPVEFMMRNPQFPWDPIVITRRADFDTILSNPRFKWVGSSGWDVNTLSTRPGIADYLVKLQDKGVQLNWNIISSRSDVPTINLIHPEGDSETSEDSDSDSSYEYNEGNGVMQRIDDIQYNHPENKQFPVIDGLELYDTDGLMNKYDNKFASPRMRPGSQPGKEIKRTLPEMSDAEYQDNLRYYTRLSEITSTFDYDSAAAQWKHATLEAPVQFMMRNPQFQWHAAVLTRRADFDIILSNPDGGWDVEALSTRPQIVDHLVALHDGGVQLDWNTISSRLDIPVSFIMLHSGELPWNWPTIQKRMTIQQAVRYQQYAPLDWTRFTKIAPYSFIRKHKAPWVPELVIQQLKFVEFGEHRPSVEEVMQDIDLHIVAAWHGLQWDWEVFTHLRCNMQTLIEFPNIPWVIPVFVRSENFTKDDVYVALRLGNDKLIDDLEAGVEEFFESLAAGRETSYNVTVSELRDIFSAFDL
jgi:hypothetical protein